MKSHLYCGHRSRLVMSWRAARRPTLRDDPYFGMDEEAATLHIWLSFTSSQAMSGLYYGAYGASTALAVVGLCKWQHVKHATGR